MALNGQPTATNASGVPYDAADYASADWHIETLMLNMFTIVLKHVT